MSNEIPEVKEKNRVTANKIPANLLAQMEEQKRDEKLKSGTARPKDIEWEMFLDSKLKMKDDISAAKHLKEYINWCQHDGENIESLCYEFFLDFSQGRLNNKIKQIIKSVPLAESVIQNFKDTKDVDKLTAITSFFEKNHDLTKAEGFYFTLYELFLNGDGVDKDLNKAARYLKATINVSNTPDRRSALREIYEEQNSSLEEEERTRKAYEKVIADNIQFSKTDYANYLRSHNKRMEAVHYFVADGAFSDAYETINITIKKEIDNAVEEFKKGAADSEFAASLKLMKSQYPVLQDIFDFKEEPLTYWKMSILYSIIGPIYALYHTVKLNTTYFAGALIGIIGLSVITGIFSNKPEIGIFTFMIALCIWTIILLIVDILRRRRFIAARELYPKLQPHPNLEEKAALFGGKVWFKNHSSSWTLIIPFLILTSMPILIAVTAVEQSKHENGNPISAIKEVQNIETESREEKSVPSKVEEKSKTTESKPKNETQEKTRPSNQTPSTKPDQSNQSNSNTNVNQNATNADTINSSQNIQQNNQNAQSNKNQEEAIRALTDFHNNITKKNYQQAYNYFSKDLQKRVPYDGWAGGFKTTVSSSAADIKIVSESNDKITINYTLKAVDNPGGARNFNSTAVVVKTNNGWKLDSMSNKLKQ